MTKHLVIRCTAEERARWKAVAELEDRKRNAGRRWSSRREEGLSLLVRELLEARAKAHPAAEIKALEERARRRLEGDTDTDRRRGSVPRRRRTARAAAK